MNERRTKHHEASRMILVTGIHSVLDTLAELELSTVGDPTR